jgi:Dissimilatory sulfite reductase (desulfoviridin), alpha and beta subunits
MQHRSNEIKRKGKISLANTFECSGCTACVSICPVNAIRMVEDKEGFLNPIIDRSLCIGCQKCEKNMPDSSQETEDRRRN